MYTCASLMKLSAHVRGWEIPVSSAAKHSNVTAERFKEIVHGRITAFIIEEPDRSASRVKSTSRNGYSITSRCRVSRRCR